MKDKIKKFYDAVVVKLKEETVKTFATKIISVFLVIVATISLAVYNKIIYPSFSGNIIDVSYNAHTSKNGGIDLDKALNFENVSDETFYYYEGDLQITVQGKGKIGNVYILYSDNGENITSGDVYRVDVKKNNNKYIIEHEINMRTNNVNNYGRIYIIIFDKKTEEKYIYCLAINLDSVDKSLIFHVVDEEHKENLVDDCITEEDLEKDIELKFQYEVCSKEELQKIEKYANASYMSIYKRDILQEIEKIENMDIK